MVNVEGTNKHPDRHEIKQNGLTKEEVMDETALAYIDLVIRMSNVHISRVISIVE